MATDSEKAIWILYKNHKGVVAWRPIVPLIILWGTEEWHPGEQWYLHAFAEDREGEIRSFALL
jgi:hypothetical protein